MPPENAAPSAASASGPPVRSAATCKHRAIASNADRPLRLLIAGGGTGGHVLPAVAVMQELRTREIETDVLWVGSLTGLEREVAAHERIPFRAIATGKLRRYLTMENVRDAFRLPSGYFEARPIVRDFQPDIVFSTGGFVSVPTVLASRKIAPILTHEQTAILGLATRLNLRSADVLAVSFAATAQLAEGRVSKTIVTGNPVRQSLFAGDAAAGRKHFGFTADLPIIVIMGGARGASPINRRVEPILSALLHHCQIVHQTGPASANSDAAELRVLQATWPEHVRRRYQIVEYIGDELADLYASTDLVLARAGAGTVAEVAALGIPSVLIPLPGAGGDEQTRNGQLLASSGAAIVLPQEQASSDRLRSLLQELLEQPERRKTMADAARTLGKPDAASSLVDALLEHARVDTSPSR